MSTDPVNNQGVTVLIPSYNEGASLPSVVRAVQEALRGSGGSWQILVVDDGSTDDSAQVAESLDIDLVRHDSNLGYGASLKTGIRRARYDVVAIIDADGTYPPTKLPEVVGAMDDVDMVVGARTGENVNIPFLRKPMKWCLRTLAEFLAGVSIPDLNSGLRCFRKSTIIEYMHLLPNGFSFTTTLTLAYHSDSRLVRYLPINYEKRTGRSKIRPLKDSYGFLLLILRTIMYFDPMRIFMPPALLAFGITTATLTYEIFWTRNIAEKSVLWLMITILLFAIALLGDLIAKRRS